MTKHHTSQRINNRGSCFHLNLRAKDRLEDEACSLSAELGVGNQSEPTEPKAAQDDGFGVAEVVMSFAVFALAGLLAVNI